MQLGDLLDDGGRRGMQVLSGVAMAVTLALFVAVLIPVIVVAGAAELIKPFASELVGVGSPQAPPAFTIPERGRVSPPTSVARGAVELARQYEGVRYRFGGADPASGLDCSGLVQLVFRQLGVNLPHNAQLQYNATARLTADELQPGDLVFFAHTYSDP